MSKVKQDKTKTLCVDDLRHAEYYGMQPVFDELYEKSSKGENFSDLMDIVLSRENILLAYRNIKANAGSKTAGTDNLTIQDIGKLSPEEVVEKVRYIVRDTPHGYRPKPVRRKDIPKPNGNTRPLGIPCIWDRLVQQCIKQVMEPICEAKFSENSFGFRPQRSTEHAIARTNLLIDLVGLHQVVEFDIKGFFDNVNHAKLIRQIWALGIHDKSLIYILRKMLEAPIRMPDASTIFPSKGTPQGGIISPLLANIVLNELDHWIESQWENSPIRDKYKVKIDKKGRRKYGAARQAMKTTNLKEIYIVRYADDFRILCRTRTAAKKIKTAVTQWLQERLKLEVSPEKTRIVNVKRQDSEFLGFRFRARPKGKRCTARTRVSNKALKRIEQNLIKQAKYVATPRPWRTQRDEIRLYNSMVMGVQNYYCHASGISLDFGSIQRRVATIFENRLGGKRDGRLARQGRALTKTEKARYGKSEMIRYIKGINEPIYPVGFIRYKRPFCRKLGINQYTPQGRAEVHTNLQINTKLMQELMRTPQWDRSIEMADNRISLFSAQWGKCAITGVEFETADEIICHRKTPLSRGGTDKYDNLILVRKPVHYLIYATDPKKIQGYCDRLNLNSDQLKKINKLRKLVDNEAIEQERTG